MEPFWTPLAVFSLSFIPGAFALVFVRKKFLNSWAMFALVYLFFVFYILANQSIGGWNNRLLLAPMLGIALSIITILWAIIHSLIFHRSEKK